MFRMTSSSSRYRLLWFFLGLAIILSTVVVSLHPSIADVANDRIQLQTPIKLGGYGGEGDQRDIDIYPTIAYDAVSQRYLAVWLSGRNAGSSSDGLDVYGIFVDPNGNPLGNEFRISDQNTVALSNLPIVVAGAGEFIVVWTVRGNRCTLRGQRVVNTSSHSDWVLASGSSHLHSPAIVFNPTRGRYVVAYVAGDDYMPPTLFGSDIADCGNNAASASQVRAMEFHLSNGNPVIDVDTAVSDANIGAFRPSLAIHSGLNEYLVAWEDRRDAGANTKQFGVYAQRLNTSLTRWGSNISLGTGGDYSNEDGSATWTPRPSIGVGNDNRFVTWFEKVQQVGASQWHVKGAMVSPNNPPSIFTVLNMTFAEQHPGNAPTGFLATSYNRSVSEYLVAVTTHMESIWGYLSSTRIQRVTDGGELLKLDGSVRSAPGVGYAVDYENDDQVSLGIAANERIETGASDFMAVYSKHASSQHARDYDIWSVKMRVPVASLEPVLWLPIAWR